MPWADELSHPQDLRDYVRDLIALSTLPAVWRDYEPQQIAESVAAALLSMLGADFLCVTLPGVRNDPAVEVTRASRRMTAHFVSAVGSILRGTVPWRTERTMSIPGPAGEGALSIVSAPLGFGGHSLLVAGSLRAEFPNEKDRLLLGIAANDATIALNRWLAETEGRRLGTIIERSSEFIGFATMDGRPQYLNPGGRRLVGLSVDETISHLRIFDFLTEHDRERMREILLPTVLSTGRWFGELDFCHFRTGEVIPFFVDWFRVDDRRTGRPISLATVSRDLRDQKKLESDLRQMNESLERRVVERTTELRRQIAERERAEARARDLQQELLHASRLSVAGQMAGALAHEINQPLTALTNSVNAVRRIMASDGNGSADVCREIIDEAAELALRTGRIIRRLRDFVARGETEMLIERLPVLIQDAADFALAGARNRGDPVKFRFDPKAESVLADRVQVQQLLVNLLRNANEAMAGWSRQELTVSTALLAGGMVEVAVADRGPGLPDEISGHLFEAFRSTKRDGMGLGLTICRSIAEAHGGSLRYEPNPGGGAIFRFSLPGAPRP